MSGNRIDCMSFETLDLTVSNASPTNLTSCGAGWVPKYTIVLDTLCGISGTYGWKYTNNWMSHLSFSIRI